MKLSISNIAWESNYDEVLYKYMGELGYEGLEIAPTRIFKEPYCQLKSAHSWADYLFRNYNLRISSLQSIWYGRTEKIFGSDDDRQILLSHNRKVVDFAAAVGTQNLVFGCPKNRNISSENDYEIAIHFFKVLAEQAWKDGVVIAFEANPVIYNTNFINTTKDAVLFIRDVNHPGLRLNLDIGTIIYNDETLEWIESNVSMINHVHISEPGLKQIKRRSVHQDLIRILQVAGYNRYISIEMGKGLRCDEIIEIMRYVRELIYAS